jgi:hypothetical protein
MQLTRGSTSVKDSGGTNRDFATATDSSSRRLWTDAPLPVAGAAADVHAPAANTAAVVTYAAGGAGVSHVIAGIAWSYNADPTNGSLKVEDGAGTVIFQIGITSRGPGVIYFPLPKKGTANTAMIVTLAAGGGAVTGVVSVLSHWTEN